MIVQLIRLTRPYYTLPFTLGFAVIAAYALGGQLQGRLGALALSTLAVGLLIAGGYALNDYFDVEVDRANAADRPVATGRVSRRAAALLGIGLLTASLSLAALSGPRFLATLGAVAAALVSYDAFSKRMGPLKQVMVAALMASLYPMAHAHAGGFHGSRAASLYAFCAWLFVTAYGYEVLKDLLDAEGDRRATGRPVSLERSPRAWRHLASGAVVLGVPVALLPLRLGCGPAYLAVAAPGLLAGLAVPFLTPQRALAAIYAEVLLVALASAVDAWLGGF